jgi:hypothetical protein
MVDFHMQITSFSMANFVGKLHGTTSFRSHDKSLLLLLCGLLG